MAMFDRKKNEFPSLKYKVGYKIMGYHTGMGSSMLVGGVIVEATQSTSYLDENEYKVRLELELCEVCEIGKDLTWRITEEEAQPFKQDVWDRTVRHWIEHCGLQRKAYLEYVRMHKALRGESDDMSDAVLEKELDEMHNAKGK